MRWLLWCSFMLVLMAAGCPRSNGASSMDVAARTTDAARPADDHAADASRIDATRPALAPVFVSDASTDAGARSRGLDASTPTAPDATAQHDAGLDAAPTPQHDAALDTGTRAAHDAAPDYGGCATREILISDMTMFSDSVSGISFRNDDPQGGRVAFHSAPWGSNAVSYRHFASLKRSIENSQPVVELYAGDGGMPCTPEVRFPITLALSAEEETIFTTTQATGHLVHGGPNGITPGAQLNVEYEGAATELSFAAMLHADGSTADLDRFRFEAVLLGDTPHQGTLSVFRGGEPPANGLRILDWDDAPPRAASADNCMGYGGGSSISSSNAAVFSCIKSARSAGTNFYATFTDSYFLTQREVGRLDVGLERDARIYYELNSVSGHANNARQSTVHRCADIVLIDPCTDMNGNCYTCTDPGPTYKYSEFDTTL